MKRDKWPRNENVGNNLHKHTQNINVFLSGEISNYEYLTREVILPPKKVDQAKTSYVYLSCSRKFSWK